MHRFFHQFLGCSKKTIIVFMLIVCPIYLLASDIESLLSGNADLFEVLGHLDDRYHENSRSLHTDNYVTFKVSLAYSPSFANLSQQATVRKIKSSIKERSAAQIRDLLFKYIYVKNVPYEVKTEAWQNSVYDPFKPVGSKVSTKRNSPGLFFHEFYLVLPLHAIARHPGFWYELLVKDSPVQSFSVNIYDVFHTEYLGWLTTLWLEEPSVSRETITKVLNHPSRMSGWFQSSQLVSPADLKSLKALSFYQLPELSSFDSPLYERPTEALRLHQAATAIASPPLRKAGLEQPAVNSTSKECLHLVPGKK